ncbi:hypothetical protein I7I48_08224 [Histoplasma ohiense]|nr:hypothetical protein I7I48_08224 [Histoplasma ohiense (nom. inval.)]
MTSICSICHTCATAESEAANIMKENCETHTSATESVQQASSFSMKLNSEYSSEENISVTGVLRLTIWYYPNYRLRID